MELELTITDVTAAPVHADFDNYLRHIASQASLGHTLEFGVWQGTSLRILCGCRDYVTGFDTFTGLPESWDLGTTGTFHEVGYFRYPEWQTAKWPTNCTLVDGLFADTLPSWLAGNAGAAGLVHIDSDIYSSARDVLTLLNDRIVPGTILAFDELSDWQSPPIYLTWREHEWRALNEWMQTYHRKAVPIARTNRYQAALRVTQ